MNEVILRNLLEIVTMSEMSGAAHTGASRYISAVCVSEVYGIQNSDSMIVHQAGVCQCKSTWSRSTAIAYITLFVEE